MRILHTMLRVGDLERSIRFYTEVLGMQLLRRKDYPEGKFTLVFVGYGSEADSAVIELTYNWGVERYELGTAYGHIAIQVDDIHASCNRVRTLGGNGKAGFADGTGADARFNEPRGLALDPAGNLLVADFGNDAIRLVTMAGAVSTGILNSGIR